MSEKKSQNAYGPDGTGGCCCILCFAVAAFGWIGLSVYQDVRELNDLLPALSPELHGLADLYAGTKDQVREDPILLEGRDGNIQKATPDETFVVQDRALFLQASDEIRERKREVTLGNLLQ